MCLLVVALEVPSSSEELIAVFWQFPAFALCFAFILVGVSASFATAKIVYQVAQRWDPSLGDRLFDRVIDTDTLQNKTKREQITVGVGYRF